MVEYVLGPFEQMGLFVTMFSVHQAWQIIGISINHKEMWIGDQGVRIGCAEKGRICILHQLS